MSTSRYELATDQLRQVMRERGGPLHGGEWCVVSHSLVNVQRKWLVENGEPYSGEQRGPLDHMLAAPNQAIISSHLYATLTATNDPAQSIYWWLPIKEEWRDLPVVNERDVT